MFFEETRVTLLALLNQPIAVASAVVLMGLHAALWLLVFERVGFPTVLASLLLVPPLTFLLPLHVVLARLPNQRVTRFPSRTRRVATRSRPFVAPRRPSNRPLQVSFSHQRQLHLASDGLPRVRIPLPTTPPTEWLASQAEPRYIMR